MEEESICPAASSNFMKFSIRTRKPVSFSTEFVFSISPGGHGDGLALVILPHGDVSQIFVQGTFGISKNLDKFKGKLIAIEFGTPKEAKSGRVGVDVRRFESGDTKYVLLLKAGVKRGRKINLEGRHSTYVEININSQQVFSCVYLVDTEEQHLVNQNLTFNLYVS